MIDNQKEQSKHLSRDEFAKYLDEINDGYEWLHILERTAITSKSGVKYYYDSRENDDGTWVSGYYDNKGRIYRQYFFGEDDKAILIWLYDNGHLPQYKSSKQVE